MYTQILVQNKLNLEILSEDLPEELILYSMEEQ